MNSSDIRKEYFEDPTRQWDTVPYADLLNIVFIGGTYGHFLKFIVDKFSTITPELNQTPVSKLGTFHETINYSNKVCRYHMSFTLLNKNENNLPVCCIAPTSDIGLLFFRLSFMFRSGLQQLYPDMLWQRSIPEQKNYFYEYVESIKRLYNLKENCVRIPKFIVRDWYKLGYLQNDKSMEQKIYEDYKGLEFFKRQNVFNFPLESFFTFNKFINSLQKLDTHHNLKIDFQRTKEIEEFFNIGISGDKYRQQIVHVQDILQSILKQSPMQIDELDVLFEAYIYAQIEKSDNLIKAPLSNSFFNNTNEIFDLVNFYPDFYKVNNPNLKKK